MNALGEDGLLENVNDGSHNEAFREFFRRTGTRDEIDKVLRGRYADADFVVFEKALRESCQGTQSPLPDANLYRFIEMLAEDLVELLEQEAEYREPLARSLEALKHEEPAHRNYSQARREYV